MFRLGYHSGRRGGFRLVPQGVGNLLVAERCVARDKISHTAVHNMMFYSVTGQGAGVDRRRFGQG